MVDAWIMICVLCGIALVANIAVCIYTLNLARRLKLKYYHEGFCKGILESKFGSVDGYTYYMPAPTAESNPSEDNSPENSTVPAQN